MRLHLDRDRDEPLLWEETVRLEPEALGSDLLLEIGPIDVKGRVDRIDDEFRVAMDLRYDQALACTRCLQPVRSEVATHVDLQVVTRPKDAHGRGRARDAQAKESRAKDSTAAPELVLEKDELGVLVLPGEHLETEPLIAEQVLLEAPMKPLCAADCKGLCPRCGADRNVTPDCCAEPVADERWEALGALRDQLSAKGR
jgi:uncharacterized protein